VAVEESERDCRSSELAGNAVAFLAHEINNPLACLLDLLFLLEADTSLSETACRYVTQIQEEVQRIARITHGAMNGYGPAASPATSNVPELMASILDFYKSRLDSGGISINARYCSDGDLTVFIGPLRQMFSSLLLNAADAMPAGGTIFARVSSAHEWAGLGRHGLRITIGDTGCGITTANLPRITQPFFTTKGASGTGLGLALVRDVVEKHHGVLRVRSSTKPGRTGSVFTVFLPSA
jgi:signal transduction histidine kinase